MKQTLSNEVIADLVDYLMPELTPYETAMYIFLLRHATFNGGKVSLRIGKKAIAARFAKGARGGNRSNYQHISNTLKTLEKKGCLRSGETTREGTSYALVLPRDVPLAAAKLASGEVALIEDFFTRPEKRRQLFDRDKWRCQYCGDLVTEANATLDHFNPQSKGGEHSKDNLRTACLLCNSIKSGRSYEEVAGLILSSVRERRAKNGERPGR